MGDDAEYECSLSGSWAANHGHHLLGTVSRRHRSRCVSRLLRARRSRYGQRCRPGDLDTELRPAGRASQLVLQLRPGSQLIHAMAWGPLLERRYRMRSGLQVDVGLVPRVWLSCHSIRAHNESSRWAHRALGLTRTPISCRRSARQQSRVGRPATGRPQVAGPPGPMNL
jgi:hypothetical protein